MNPYVIAGIVIVSLLLVWHVFYKEVERKAKEKTEAPISVPASWISAKDISYKKEPPAPPLEKVYSPKPKAAPTEIRSNTQHLVPKPRDEVKIKEADKRSDDLYDSNTILNIVVPDVSRHAVSNFVVPESAPCEPVHQSSGHSHSDHSHSYSDTSCSAPSPDFG